MLSIGKAFDLLSTVWILDTDHLTAVGRGGVDGETLRRRFAEMRQQPAITIVTLEEQLRGWLAQVKRARRPNEEIIAYGRLLAQFRFFERWTIVPWNRRSASHFQELQYLRTKIGAMDLRIAAIALASDATIVTRNLADFGQVPGLRIENWLDLN